LGAGQAITDDAGRAGGAAALQPTPTGILFASPHLVSETTRCLPLMGRLGCIKSTLYGNVELFRQTLSVNAIALVRPKIYRCCCIEFLDVAVLL
jgi:hypothetical protein